MIRQIVLPFLLALGAAVAYADDSVELRADTVLVSRGGVEVTLLDFETALRQVPEAHRRTVADHPERMARILEDLVKQRLVAREARGEGLHENPGVAAELRQREDRVLYRRHLDRIVEQAAAPDLEQQAKEYYLTNRDEFRVQERVRVCHVLVSTSDRSAEAARERATHVRDMAVNGARFSDLVAEYSDDPDAPRNQGCLDWVTRERLTPEFRDAAFALEEPGQISDPISTKIGYYIIKLEARQESRVRSFDEVRPELIDRMRKSHAERVRERYIAELLRENPLQAEPDVIGALRDRYRHEVGESE